MTKAEKLVSSPIPRITLRRNEKGDLIDNYVVSFIPAMPNTLIIRDINYKGSDPVPGSAIVLSDESAVALAKFLKELYLDQEK